MYSCMLVRLAGEALWQYRTTKLRGKRTVFLHQPVTEDFSAASTDLEVSAIQDSKAGTTVQAKQSKGPVPS